METDVISGSFNGILAGSEHLLSFIMGKFQKAPEFLLYSSGYIGIMAVAMTYTSSSLQNLPWNPSAAIILSFVVFSVYNLNRKTDAAEDALNHAGRFSFTSRYGQPLFFSALAAYGGALILAASAGPAGVLLAAVPLLAGIIYSVPLLSGFCGYQRVKEIPVMKNIVVSGSWAITFSFLPVLLAGTFPDIHSLVVFALIFEYVFIASVLPDIRDREGDAATQVYTIPVLIGVEKTRLFLTAFNLVVGAFLLTLGSTCLPPLAWIILLISIAYSQFCILSVGQTRFNNFLIDVISDGEFLYIGILFCILNTGFPAL
jgi:4-hydroxybenzoate polyprenyltransferase